MKPSAKAAKTRKTKKKFKEWNENKYSIYSRDKRELILHPDEDFVPGFYPGESKPDYTFYVSNYGNVISFRRDEPLWVQPIRNKKGEDGVYLKVDDNKYIHTLVWFSFAYDAIENDKTLPLYDYHKEIKDKRDLIKLAGMKKKDFEIHHIKMNPEVNLLSKLELVDAKLHKKRSSNVGIHGLYTAEKNGDYEKAWSIGKKLYEGILKDKGRVISISEEELITEQVDREEIFRCILSGFNPNGLYYVQRMLRLAEEEKYKNYFVNKQRMVCITVNNENEILNIYTNKDLSFKVCPIDPDKIDVNTFYVAEVSEDKINESVMIGENLYEQNL